MTKRQSPNRISELRLNRGWSQGDLGDRCGAHWVTISKLERGQMQLTQEWMEKLGKVFSVHPTELFPDSPLYRTIYMAGSVKGANNLEQYDSISNENSSEPNLVSDINMRFSVQFGTPQPDRTVWYLIETDLFYPIIRDGDLVRFTYPDEGEQCLFFGRLCLIELKNRKKSKMIGVPARGSSQGLFDIHVFGDEMLIDQHIDAMAYMSMVISNPDVEDRESGIQINY